MKTIIKFPYYCFIFAIYPVFALMANNITENKFEVVIRPLLLSIFLSAFLLLVIWLFFRDIQKSGLMTLFTCFLFFSFGHILSILDGVYILGFNIGRVRFLIFLFLLLVILGVFLIKRIKVVPANLPKSLLVISLVLLVFPVSRIILHSINSMNYDKKSEQKNSLVSIQPNPSTEYPDIYYIILDSYTRQDVLLQEYNYDNEPFLDQLKGYGFFIGDCSQSNYLHTLYSLPSSLNMDYLPNLDNRLEPGKLNPDILINLIRHSKVRSELNKIGYRFIAFENSYIRTQIPDADEYIITSNLSISQLLGGYITPFEEMFIKTTAGVVFYRIQFGKLSDSILKASFPYYELANIQLSQLKMLPEIAKEQGPKFVFVHMNIPHSPFIFDENGGLLTDPGYYEDNGRSRTKQYEIDGYTKQIAFLNNQLPAIISTILSESKVKPVIIIQGDHGLDTQNRSKILNAIYFPDQNYSMIYPKETPVNTFRIVFNKYFGGSYPLLKDEVEEVYPAQDFTYKPVVEDSLCK